MVMAHKYGVRLSHTPDICPLSNKASREFAKKGLGKMQELTQKHKVKVESLYHFDPEHLVIGVFEAENIESLRDLLMEMGLMHWNDLKINPVTPAETIMKTIDSMPTLF